MIASSSPPCGALSSGTPATPATSCCFDLDFRLQSWLEGGRNRQSSRSTAEQDPCSEFPEVSPVARHLESEIPSPEPYNVKARSQNPSLLDLRKKGRNVTLWRFSSCLVQAQKPSEVVCQVTCFPEKQLRSQESSDQYRTKNLLASCVLISGREAHRKSRKEEEEAEEQE